MQVLSDSLSYSLNSAADRAKLCGQAGPGGPGSFCSAACAARLSSLASAVPLVCLRPFGTCKGGMFSQSYES